MPTDDRTREAKIRERALAIAHEEWEKVGPHLERAQWLADAVAIRVFETAYAEGREDGLEEAAIYAEGHSQRGLDAAKAAGKKLYHEDCDKKIAAGIRSLSSRKAAGHDPTKGR